MCAPFFSFVVGRVSDSLATSQLGHSRFFIRAVLATASSQHWLQHAHQTLGWYTVLWHGESIYHMGPRARSVHLSVEALQRISGIPIALYCHQNCLARGSFSFHKLVRIVVAVGRLIGYRPAWSQAALAQRGRFCIGTIVLFRPGGLPNCAHQCLLWWWATHWPSPGLGTAGLWGPAWPQHLCTIIRPNMRSGQLVGTPFFWRRESISSRGSSGVQRAVVCRSAPAH